jgi:hypothetical protein
MRAMLTGSIVAQLFAVMSRKPFLVMAALLSIAPADTLYAQDEGEKPAPTVRTADGGREAVTRGDRPRAVERSAPQPAGPPPTATSAIRPADAPALQLQRRPPTISGGVMAHETATTARGPG